MIPLRIKLFALLYLLLQGSTVAVSQNIDSLRSLLKRPEIPDTTTALVLAELAYQTYGINPDSSFILANKADKISEKIQFKKGRGASIRVIGVCYAIRGDFKKATECLEKALSYSLEAKDKKNIGRCYSNLALLHHNQWNFSKAIEWHLKSLKLREEIDDKRGIGETCNNIAMLYSSLGNSDKAREYAQRALATHTSINNKRGIGYSYSSMSFIFKEEGEFQKALDYTLKAIPFVEEEKDSIGLSGMFAGLADIYLSLGNFRESLKNLKKAEKIALQLNSNAREAYVNSIYAKYYNSTGNPTAAYDRAEKLDDYAKKNGGVEFLRIAAHEKYLACYKLGRYKEALLNHEKYIVYRDSIQNERTTRKFIEKEFELKEEKLLTEQTKKNVEHNAQLKLLAKENESERQITLLFVVGFFFAIVFSLVIFRNYRKRVQLAARLASQNEEIRTQNELIESINKELLGRALRAQINPHFIFNSLNSIQALVIDGKIDSASDYIGKFAQLLRRILVHSEESWITLEDEMNNIRLYIELEALRLGGSFHYSINCTVENPEMMRLPSMIIQPYVENAIHHGLLPLTERPRDLQITFSENDDHLILEVLDNGIGRKNSAQLKSKGKYTESKGMFYTQERIHALNALSKTHSFVKIYDLENAKGESAGTKVVISLAQAATAS